MKTFYFSFVAVLLFSCNSNDNAPDNCIAFKDSPVETVESIGDPDSVNPVFDVGFRLSSGCGEFSSFEQTTQGNETTIKVIAKYVGCVCTTDAHLRQTVYTFTQSIPGTYILKFKKFDDTYITKIVVIEN